MDRLLLAMVLIAAMLGPAESSDAYFRGAWCAKIDVGGGTVQERCDFSTFEACRDYTFHEVRAFCERNPWFAPNWGITGGREKEQFNRHYR